MALDNGTMNGMLRMVQLGDADVAAGPFAASNVIFEQLHIPPTLTRSLLVMLSGMKTPYVQRAQSFTNSFESEVSYAIFGPRLGLSPLHSIRFDNSIPRQVFAENLLALPIYHC